MNIVFLDIKSASIAAEQRIIRKARRAKIKHARWQTSQDQHHHWISRSYGLAYAMETHDKFDLRRKARDTHLARAFIRGQAYREVEQDPHWMRADWCGAGYKPDAGKIAAMVVRYGTDEQRKHSVETLTIVIKAWFTVARQLTNRAPKPKKVKEKIVYSELHKAILRRAARNHLTPAEQLDKDREMLGATVLGPIYDEMRLKLTDD